MTAVPTLAWLARRHRHGSARVAYWILKAVLTPLLRLLYRVRVEGKENVPRQGPLILAANHRSFMDSLFLPLVIPRRVTFVAKAEYFDSKKTAWFFRAVGQIPIRREGGSASEGALAAATGVLQDGQVFGIYPEGTRTRDGYLHRGHTGVARLALRTGAPVVPVGMIGTDEIQATDSKMPRLFRTVTIRFGEPIRPEHYRGREDDSLVLRTITDEVMFEIRQISGYEYVDTYATRKAEDLPVDTAKVTMLEPIDDPSALQAVGAGGS
jgi:1-acyl-sn-glycerol-3-phosphate acyltransferase